MFQGDGECYAGLVARAQHAAPLLDGPPVIPPPTFLFWIKETTTETRVPAVHCSPVYKSVKKVFTSVQQCTSVYIRVQLCKIVFISVHQCTLENTSLQQCTHYKMFELKRFLYNA